MIYKVVFEGFANVEADNVNEAEEMYKQNKYIYKEEIIKIMRENGRMLEDKQWTSKL